MSLIAGLALMAAVLSQEAPLDQPVRLKVNGIDVFRYPDDFREVQGKVYCLSALKSWLTASLNQRSDRPAGQIAMVFGTNPVPRCVVIRATHILAKSPKSTVLQGEVFNGFVKSHAPSSYAPPRSSTAHSGFYSTRAQAGLMQGLEVLSASWRAGEPVMVIDVEYWKDGPAYWNPKTKAPTNTYVLAFPIGSTNWNGMQIDLLSGGEIVAGRNSAAPPGPTTGNRSCQLSEYRERESAERRGRAAHHRFSETSCG